MNLRPNKVVHLKYLSLLIGHILYHYKFQYKNILKYIFDFKNSYKFIFQIN